MCETNVWPGKVGKTFFSKFLIVSGWHTHLSDRFPGPKALETMQHIKKSYERPATVVRGKRAGEWENGAGCGWSMGQMLAGRFWLYVLSLSLAFIHSPMTSLCCQMSSRVGRLSSRPMSKCGWLQTIERERERDTLRLCVLLASVLHTQTFPNMKWNAQWWISSTSINYTESLVCQICLWPQTNVDLWVDGEHYPLHLRKKKRISPAQQGVVKHELSSFLIWHIKYMWLLCVYWA